MCVGNIFNAWDWMSEEKMKMTTLETMGRKEATMQMEDEGENRRYIW